MMGDNRDNNSDVVFGVKFGRDIVGKAVAIWMHWRTFSVCRLWARRRYD